MLVPRNGYVFIEKVNDDGLITKGLILDNNLNRDMIIRGKVFIEHENNEYSSKYLPGTEVLCDIVGSREFEYKGKLLHIVTDDAVFGIFNHGTVKEKKSVDEIIIKMNTEGN